MYVRSAPQLWVSFTLFVKYQTQSHLDKPIKPIFIKKIKMDFCIYCTFMVTRPSPLRSQHIPPL